MAFTFWGELPALTQLSPAFVGQLGHLQIKKVPNNYIRRGHQYEQGTAVAWSTVQSSSPVHGYTVQRPTNQQYLHHLAYKVAGYHQWATWSVEYDGDWDARVMLFEREVDTDN